MNGRIVGLRDLGGRSCRSSFEGTYAGKVHGDTLTRLRGASFPEATESAVHVQGVHPPDRCISYTVRYIFGEDTTSSGKTSLGLWAMPDDFDT